MIKHKKVSLMFYTNSRKKNKKTGKIPVYLKLTYNGQKVETRLPDDLDLTESSLSLWDEGLMRTREKDSKLNAYLNKIDSIWDTYKISNNYVPRHSLHEILGILTQRTEASKDLITVFKFCEGYISHNIDNNNNMAEGTKRNYRKAFTHFKNYLDLNKYISLPLNNFKHPHATGFQLYMGKEANNSAVSSSTNIRRIKTIFNEAIHQEIISKNPFDKIKLVLRSANKTPSLTINQVKQIMECNSINTDENLIFYKDLFLFGCFTGLSCKSIIKLNKAAVFPIYDNRLKMDTSRVKTKKFIIQIIPKPAQRIIEKYAQFSSPKRVEIFPNFCNETFNEKLKIICVHAGLNINLTTKISRTTCNQIIVNTGHFDMIYKRAYLGWSNQSDIQDVYTTLEDNVLLQNTERLEKYLLTNLGEDLLKNFIL